MIQKIVDITELEKRVAQWRVKSNQIVFTNGCFDILHVGHLHTLQEAKKLGNKLIVAINSDESVKRLKGEERPINEEINRAALIAALEVVDLLVIFTDDTPLALIEAVRPDTLVKGGDWSINQIVGGDFVTKYGGRVASIPFKDGYSSTHLIEKIKSL